MTDRRPLEVFTVVSPKSEALLTLAAESGGDAFIRVHQQKRIGRWREFGLGDLRIRPATEAETARLRQEAKALIGCEIGEGAKARTLDADGAALNASVFWRDQDVETPAPPARGWG